MKQFNVRNLHKPKYKENIDWHRHDPVIKSATSLSSLWTFEIEKKGYNQATSW